VLVRYGQLMIPMEADLYKDNVNYSQFYEKLFIKDC